MSHFLQNIILRHQIATDRLNADTDSQGDNIVRPRLASRYEADTSSRVGNDFSQVMESEHKVPTPSMTGRKTADRKTELNAAPDTHFNEEYRANDVPARNSDKPFVFNQLMSQREITSDSEKAMAADNIGSALQSQTAVPQQKPLQQPLTMPFTPSSKEQSLDTKQDSDSGQTFNQQSLSVFRESQPHVQEIVHRLSIQHGQSPAQPIPTTTNQPSALPEIDKSISNESETMFASHEATDNFANHPEITERTTLHQLQLRQSGQSGLLQTPSELTTLLPGFNQGRREDDKHSSVESVVNVSIGRVEVKAVPAQNKKTPKSIHKPSGIMSLGDYLKRRDGEGQ